MEHRAAMATITASVGRGGINRRNDIETVQKLLNRNIKALAPLPALVEDGRAGPQTIRAIEDFQRKIMRMPPTGRVDPNSTTLSALGVVASAAPAAAATPRVTVTYATSLPEAERIVSKYTLDVIRTALQKAGMPQAVITSTIRTPGDQARIMYDNAKKGLAGQFQLYGQTGDEVLKVFQLNQAKEKSIVVGLMKDKIEALLKLGRRTSSHCVTAETYRTLNIVDIGVNSTRAVCGASFNVETFTTALEGMRADGYIEKLIDETRKTNNCWHIEVKPNKKPLPPV
jgi:peptidoglycan hydrolase-like protein with peptidoglycan-binding domain